MTYHRPNMASPSICAVTLWCVTLVAALRISQAAPSLKVDPFPKECKIVNKTYVDCSHCSLKTIPKGIPVTVQTLDLSHNTIHTITNESFHGLVSLSTLLLNYNSISHIQSDFFTDQMKLKSLILNHNQIGKLPVDVFSNTPHIEVLDLSYMNNGFTTIPELALSNLKELRVLDFFSNRLLSANFGSSTSLGTLETLNLGMNKITALHDGDFAAMENASLLKLDLTVNHIEDIEAGVFHHFTRVDTIDMSRGLLPKAIPLLASALSNVTVQALYLRQIGLRNWNSENFKGLTNSPMTKLDLSFNDLTSLNSSFIGLANLTSLILGKNKIREITYTAFSGLLRVEILDLSNNSFVSIDNGTFASLSTMPVRTLYLNGNKIASLGMHAFTGLPKLKYLKLSKNVISQKLQGDEFFGLDALEVLDLGLNADVRPMADAFRHLQNLQTLYMNRVKLKNITVRPSPFNSLRQLTKLDLSNNNMDAVDVDVFSNLLELETLYLQHNNLYNMWNQTTHVRFLKTLRKLKYLDLCFNGFQNIPNNTFATQRKLETFYLCNNRITNLEEGVFVGLPLRSLDLKNNEINLVNRTTLAPVLGSLETFSVSGNPFSCGCELQWFRNWLDSTEVQVTDLDHCKCESPPPMRGKRLMTFHPETLNCDHHLPLYAWILIGVGSASVILISGLVVKFRWYIMYYYYLINAKRKKYKRLEGEDRAFQYDAFVSFCNDDRDWVDGELVPNVEVDGEFHLCIHERDFIPGRKIVDSIADAVDKSRYTLCVLSSKYLDSHWCKIEREFAMANLIHRDVLILIKYGEIPKKKLTRYYKLHKTMMKRTYLQWPQAPGRERDVFWQKLKAVLRDPDMRVNNND